MKSIVQYFSLKVVDAPPIPLVLPLKAIERSLIRVPLSPTTLNIIAASAVFPLATLKAGLKSKPSLPNVVTVVTPIDDPFAAGGLVPPRS